MEIALLFIALLVLILLAGKKKRKPRKRRPAFKKLYGLDQVQPLEEFEKKMIEGMFAEGLEIFVTAFTDDTTVLRVTATIGSKYKCRNSDDLSLWGEKAERIGATRIRQYHNHPDVFGRSFPSRSDKKAHRELKPFIEQWNVRFNSFLVYKGMFGIPVIKEYR